MTRRPGAARATRLLLALGLVAGCVTLAAPSVDAASGVGAYRYTSVPACGMSHGRVSTIAFPRASAAMRSAWVGKKPGQYVRDTVSVLGWNGRSWTKIFDPKYSDTTVHRSLTPLTNKSAFTGLATQASRFYAYRLRQQLTWYSPVVSGRVEGSVSRWVTGYVDGRYRPAQCTNAPGPVTNVGARTTSTSVTLSWKRPSDPYLAGAVVRVAPGSTAPASVTGGTGLRASTTGASGSVQPATGYAFSVWARDQAGHLSPRVVGHFTTKRLTPVTARVTDVQQLSSGSGHTCAVDTTQALRCWGLNAHGQLGNGTTARQPTPAVVAQSATAVSAGWGDTCFVSTTHTVQCAGAGADGVLGGGPASDRSSFQPVPGITDATQVSVGADHACALSRSRGLLCWGDNSDGQLGTGRTGAQSGPVAATALTAKLAGDESVTGVAAGWTHTCALTSYRRVWCWGDNRHGELGDGTTTTRVSPVVATRQVTVTQLVAGYHSTCALLIDQTAQCWGLGSQGQVGGGGTRDATTPQTVGGQSPSTFQYLSTEADHVCGVVANADGAVECWGANGYGQVGDGSATNRSRPVAVPGVSGAAAVAAGGMQSCALAKDRTVTCWGSDADGQLGDG